MIITKRIGSQIGLNNHHQDQSIAPVILAITNIIVNIDARGVPTIILTSLLLLINYLKISSNVFTSKPAAFLCPPPPLALAITDTSTSSFRVLRDTLQKFLLYTNPIKTSYLSGFCVFKVSEE